jgi:Domain of unknown function (DUF5667)
VRTVTKLVFRNQRAERFAQLLDEAGGRRRRHTRTAIDDQLTELVAIGRQLGELTDASAVDESFKVELRAHLMARAEREGIGVTAAEHEVEPQPQPTRGGSFGLRGRARAAVLIGLAAGTLFVSSFSAASDDAVPGDSLYILKRQAENAQLAIATSDVSRGQLYLAFAKTRAEEAQRVRTNPEALQSLLADMNDEIYIGVRLLTTTAVQRHDAAPLNSVSNFVASQRDAIITLNKSVPEQWRPWVTASLELLDKADKRAADLRQALQCQAGTETDRLGPLPGKCGP